MTTNAMASPPRVGVAIRHAEPPAVARATAAGGNAVGGNVGSGHVAMVNELSPYYGPGLVPGGSFPLGQGSPYLLDLPPDSLYQSRPLFGGVQTLSAFGEFTPNPPFMGAFQVLTGRPSLALIEGEQMRAQSFASDASWREAPPVLNLCRRTPGSGA